MKMYLQEHFIQQEDKLIKSKSCPISFQQIDATTARISAYFVVLIVFIYLFTSQILFLYLLTLDFFIRIYLNKSYSIIFQLSQFAKKILKLETEMTDAAAKKLASQFGLIFSVLLVFEALFDLQLTFFITVSILLFCASLEALFNYCVGCEIFYILNKRNLL